VTQLIEAFESAEGFLPEAASTKIAQRNAVFGFGESGAAIAKALLASGASEIDKLLESAPHPCGGKYRNGSRRQKGAKRLSKIPKVLLDKKSASQRFWDFKLEGCLAVAALVQCIRPLMRNYKGKSQSKC
jgi:hypothetical protein